jgi:hypothetical protein
MSMWNHWNNMSDDVIAALKDAPDMKGQHLPDPPDSFNDAFDDWLRRTTQKSLSLLDRCELSHTSLSQ